MAIQILPREQSFGASIGSILGSGLGQGLSQLANNKVQEIQLAKQAKAWESIGVPSNYANFIVQQPEWLQREFVERMGSMGGESAMGGQPSASQQSLGNVFGLSKEQQKMKHAEQQLITKEVLPYIHESQKSAKGAKENDIRLKRMEKLVESGKLNNPAFASILKTLKTGVGGIFGHVGLDLTSLMSPESQEFEKLSTDFVKNAKDIFGSRITDTDLKSFLATIPNLSQTNEGKKAVIRNLQLMNKAAIIKNDATRYLLKKYNNKPPLDLANQVDDLIKPEMDAITAEFESGGVPKKTSKTSSLPGDVVGGVGHLLLGNS